MYSGKLAIWSIVVFFIRKVKEPYYFSIVSKALNVNFSWEFFKLFMINVIVCL